MMDVDNEKDVCDKDSLTIDDVNIDNLPKKYVWMKVRKIKCEFIKKFVFTPNSL